MKKLKSSIAIAVAVGLAGCSDAETDGAIDDDNLASEVVESSDSNVVDQASLPADHVSAALAPLFETAPEADVLGIRLGMTDNEAVGILAERGFERQGSELYGVGFGDSYLRYATFNGGEARPGISDSILLYFSAGTQPRLVALFRNTAYRGEATVAYDTMITSLEDKYGQPTDTREITEGTEWLAWSAAGENCDSVVGAFTNLESKSYADRFGDCFRGIATKVSYQRNVDGQPVRGTNTYLTDGLAIEANRSAVDAERERQQQLEAQQRREAIEAAEPAEL